MHDIRAIRDNPAAFDAALARRGLEPIAKKILALDEARRASIKQSEEAKAVVNALSKQVGVNKARDAIVNALIGEKSRNIAPETGVNALAKDVGNSDSRWAIANALVKGTEKDKSRDAARNALAKQLVSVNALSAEAEFTSLREQVEQRKAASEEHTKAAARLDAELRDLLLTIPNLAHDDVPDGPDETFNKEIHRHGNIRNFPFPPKEHFQIPAAVPGLDFETAARLSGTRFVILKGAMVRLHRALAQFMLDTHIDQHGLTEVWTPVLVRPEAMLGTGQLPKFAEDSYQTTNGWWLIPTSEVTLTNLVAGQTLDEATLPLRFTAHSQCFRSEAGSAGRDTAGMLRQHQFEKVEMVSITKPEDSRAELDRMTKCAERILELLNLPYRTIVLCTGDMGFGARRTHDIEVWLPGQNTFREISSCSVCGDFQARRMNARYKTGTGKPEFVHTLNGSGLAVGRTLIAVVENGQEADGSISLPEVLFPYLGGKTMIAPDGTLC